MKIFLPLLFLGVASPSAPLTVPASHPSPATSSVNTSKPIFIKLTPQVEAILSRAALFYQGLQSFEVDIDSFNHSETPKTRHDSESTFHMALKQPNEFSMVVQSGVDGYTVVSDGKKLVTYEPLRHRFASNIAPPNLKEILRPVNLRFIAFGSPLGYEEFLEKDFIDQFETNLVKCEFIGLEKIVNSVANHIRLTTNAGFVSDYWIAEGEKPLLLKATWRSDMADFIKSKSPDWVKKEISDDMRNLNISRTGIYSNWHINKPILETTFQYQPLAGIQQVAEISRYPAHPLVGKAAPDFELNDLDGDTIKLSNLRGQIVVLDFWFAQCPPCVASLPVLKRVTSARQKQGVILYTINSIDNTEIIRTFQKHWGLDFSVLLDPDRKTVDHYQVQSFAISFIIDRNGKIQAVNQGYDLHLETKLSDEIDILLAGKSFLSGPAQSQK